MDILSFHLFENARKDTMKMEGITLSILAKIDNNKTEKVRNNDLLSIIKYKAPNSKKADKLSGVEDLAISHMGAESIMSKLTANAKISCKYFFIQMINKNAIRI